MPAVRGFVRGGFRSVVVRCRASRCHSVATPGRMTAPGWAFAVDGGVEVAKLQRFRAEGAGRRGGIPRSGGGTRSRGGASDGMGMTQPTPPQPPTAIHGATLVL